MPEPSVFDSWPEKQLKRAGRWFGTDLDPTDVATTAIPVAGVASQIPKGLGRLAGMYQRTRQGAKMPAQPRSDLGDRLNYWYMRLVHPQDAPYNRFPTIFDEDATNILGDIAEGIPVDDEVRQQIARRLRTELGDDSADELLDIINTSNRRMQQTGGTNPYDYTKPSTDMSRREFMVRQSGAPRRWAREELDDITGKFGENMREFFEEDYTGVLGTVEDRVENAPIRRMINRQEALNAKLGGGMLGDMAEQAVESMSDTAAKEAIPNRAVRAVQDRAALRSRNVAQQGPGLMDRIRSILGR
jgi:hypothetical protein